MYCINWKEIDFFRKHWLKKLLKIKNVRLKIVREEGRVMEREGRVVVRRKRKKSPIRSHKQYSASWLISLMERLVDIPVLNISTLTYAQRIMYTELYSKRDSI